MKFWDGKLTIYHTKTKDNHKRKKGLIAVPKHISDTYEETTPVRIYISENNDIDNYLRRDKILFKLFNFAIKEKNMTIIKYMKSKLTDEEIKFLQEMAK
ncbi:MAG: hypothetical protein DRI44_02700 [Chlamydiae bacterium]|nr:MAG: hypothetical protein DRI44_02700 [Chlamydiota bacterium]